MAELTAFLREQRKARFDWRDAHCLVLPAEWVKARHGIDLARLWPAPETEAMARNVLKEEGGVEGLMTTALSSRFAVTTSFQAGDVGAVLRRTPSGVEAVGAIWCGRRWVSRAASGLWFGGGEPLVVWATR